MASNPYSLAQDAASAIKTWSGECYFDTTQGIPYATEILGYNPPIELMKSQFVAAALTVPEVIAAKVYISGANNRLLSGQVHVTNNAGVTSKIGF
jgi:hypothetical protein